MPFEVFHFGSGVQAIHYWILSLVSILGTIQCVAIHDHRRDLVWMHGRRGYIIGLSAIVLGFVWFYSTDEEIFIPGLAGAELLFVFGLAFLVAVPLTRLVNWVLSRLASFAPAARAMKDPVGEEEGLG